MRPDPETQETHVKRILSAAAAVALGLALLTACGDDGGSKASGSGGDYCSDLKDAKRRSTRSRVATSATWRRPPTR